ncbi:MAG: acyl-CoA dehydrogenase family protein [Spirochaetota bacterium]|nr:acyl-CoA dehydrogenase family protein [Spirochaetota bacterium]
MNFQFSKNEEDFRKEIQEFLKQELPDGWGGLEESVQAPEGWEFYKNFMKKLGAKGWLTMSWPKEYGGMSATPMEQLVFMEEMAYHNAPAMSIATTWVGPTILLYGSEEQKNRYLPGISKGEIEICLGYSEPNAGSDLASLQTRAVRDGDHYIVNGQKVWTSLAHKSDYCWLAARTDPNVSKHKGISMFIVDINTPGITIRPLIDIRGFHTFNEVFFDDVKVPADCLVGGENNGWYILATALDLERTSFGGGINITADSQHILEDLLTYVKETKRNGEPLSKDPLIQHKLAQCAVEIEVSRLLAYRLSCMANENIVANHEASVSKLFGSEMSQRIAKIGMEILGLYGPLELPSKWTPLEGKIQQLYLWTLANAIGAGTSEIQRNIIALRGLNLPRK